MNLISAPVMGIGVPDLMVSIAALALDSERVRMQTFAPLWKRILTSSNPSPALPPVTMKTLPACEGMSFSVKVGFPGQICAMMICSVECMLLISFDRPIW